MSCAGLSACLVLIVLGCHGRVSAPEPTPSQAVPESSLPHERDAETESALRARLHLLLAEVEATGLRPCLDVRQVGGNFGRILVAWPNGLVAVSANGAQGGAPYRCSAPSSADLDAVLARAEKLLRAPGAKLDERAIHSDFTRIRITRGRQVSSAYSSNWTFAGDPIGSNPRSDPRAREVWFDVCATLGALITGDEKEFPIDVDRLLWGI